MLRICEAEFFSQDAGRVILKAGKVKEQQQRHEQCSDVSFFSSAIQGQLTVSDAKVKEYINNC